MEQFCYRCGARIEEGIAFCPHCNAPQIRVSSPEPPVIPPAPPINPPAYSVARSRARIEWHYALPSAMLGGLVAALLMMVPLGAFGFGMLAGGALAVSFYRRRNPSAVLTAGMGAKLGATSGAIGFGFIAALAGISVAFFHGGPEIHQVITKAMNQAVARSSDPQAAKQMMDSLQTPQGFIVIVTLGLIFTLVFFVAIASVGGALTAFLFRGKQAGTAKSAPPGENSQTERADSEKDHSQRWGQ